MTRIEHKISHQQGTLKSQGIWYSAVKFDGEDHTSWVANDSLHSPVKLERACIDADPATHRSLA